MLFFNPFWPLTALRIASLKANDAIELITDGYSINEVADKIVDFYNEKIPKEVQNQ